MPSGHYESPSQVAYFYKLLTQVRGLPYDCKPKEVAKFFDDCKIVGGDAGVFFPTNEKWGSAMFMLGVFTFLSLQGYGHR